MREWPRDQTAEHTRSHRQKEGAHHLDECHSRNLAYFEVMWAVGQVASLSAHALSPKPDARRIGVHRRRELRYSLACPRPLDVYPFVLYGIISEDIVLRAELLDVIFERECLERDAG